MTTTPSNYETFDLGAAAYLVSVGFRLLRVAGTETNRKVFVFPSEALPEATRYWNDEATVNARKMVNSMRDLKNKIYNI